MPEETPTPEAIAVLAVAVDDALDTFQTAASALVVACHQRDSDTRRPPTFAQSTEPVYGGVLPYVHHAVEDRLTRLGRDTSNFHPIKKLADKYPAPEE